MGLLSRAQSPEWAGLIAALKSSIDNKRTLAAGTAEYTAIGAYFPRYISWLYMPGFAHEWNGLSPHQQSALYNSLRLTAENSVRWYESEAATKSLFLGTDIWSEMPLDLSSSLSVPSYPVFTSLYGLLLPGGFLKWKPMEGSSSRVEIMNIAGGVQLDVRGDNVPTPAASRLFVDLSEAFKVIVPFLRAILRHALELTSNKLDDEGWRDWINGLAGSIMRVPYWQEVVCEEYSLLECTVKYAVGSKEGKTEYLSRQEVIDRYGRWAPIQHAYREGNSLIILDGIRQEGTTDMLLAVKQTRQSGSRTEVDINSFVKPEPAY